jgi:predicted nucleic acid-binding protein
MKVILDTNIWISFLLGHQTKLMRRILTDLKNSSETKIIKLSEFKVMMLYN